MGNVKMDEKNLLIIMILKVSCLMIMYSKILILSYSIRLYSCILLVADMGGTLAAVSFEGEVLWDANLSGTLPHTATIGDIDGDGQV